MEKLGLTVGFEELSHTADWAMRVWAPDISALYHQAAVGMYSLMGLILSPSGGDSQTISFKASDHECLLVEFLSELLYLSEEEQIGFSTLQVNVKRHQLTASGEIGRIQTIQKEIKAVTFHQLAVQKKEGQYEVTVVFDV